MAFSQRMSQIMSRNSKMSRINCVAKATLSILKPKEVVFLADRRLAAKCRESGICDTETSKSGAKVARKSLELGDLFCYS
jgi:hypothetical protein